MLVDDESLHGFVAVYKYKEPIKETLSLSHSPFL